MNNNDQITWDYLGHGKINIDVESQFDWNCTLLTSINLAVSKLGINLPLISTPSLILNEKIFKLIKTLPYFKEETNSLIGLKITVIPSSNNTIIIDSGLLSKLPITFKYGEINDDNSKMIYTKLIYELSNEEIIELIDNTYVKIKIENYE